MYREQKFITITDDQKRVLTENFGKINIRAIANLIGETYNKTYNNIRLLGWTIPKPVETEVVEFFDENEFFNHYKY